MPYPSSLPDTHRPTKLVQAVCFCVPCCSGQMTMRHNLSRIIRNQRAQRFQHIHEPFQSDGKSPWWPAWHPAFRRNTRSRHGLDLQPDPPLEPIRSSTSDVVVLVSLSSCFWWGLLYWWRRCVRAMVNALPVVRPSLRAAKVAAAVPLTLLLLPPIQVLPTTARATRPS
jgi:hypothetical protein